MTTTDAAGRTGTADIVVSYSVSTNPLTISVSPAAPSASRSDPGPLSVNATVSTSGGAAPFTYLWSRVTGTRITVSNTTSATATFSATLGWGETIAETFQVQVTDTIGQVKSTSVVVTFTTPAAAPLTITSITPPAPGGSRNNPGAINATATVNTSGGAAPLAYSWTRLTGTRIAAANVNAQTASFSATLGWGENLAESFRITVTDNASQTASADVTVTFTTPAQPVVSVSPAALTMTASVPGALSGSATAGGSGGVPPYSYAWARVSGSRIGVSGTETATFSTTVTYGENFTEIFQVTMTDAATNVATRTLNVTAVGPAVPPLTISVPSTVTGSVGTGVATANATVTVTSGGTGGLNFSWSKLSGDAITVSGAQTATFSGTPQRPPTQCDPAIPLVATFRATVNDSQGQVATGDVIVSLYATQPIQFVPECI